MLLHVVLFQWKEGVSEAQVAALDQAMAELPKAIPELKELQYGADVRIRGGNADYGLVALFADETGWRAYQEHPAHKAAVANLVQPIAAQRTAIQMRVPDR